jgi:hypothetical protein
MEPSANICENSQTIMAMRHNSVQRRAMPEFMLTAVGKMRINAWCVDGAATSNATFDRTLLRNIRKCNIEIFGANSETEPAKMLCTEKGDAIITTFYKATAKCFLFFY